MPSSSIAIFHSFVQEKFKQRLERAVQETREQCESLAAEEAEQVAMLHASEIDRLNKR